MSFLNGLFSIISVLFLIVLLIGLIKPSWVKMQTRGKAFLYFFSGMIVFSTLHFLTLSDEEKEKIKAESKSEVQNIDNQKTDEEESKKVESKSLESTENNLDKINMSEINSPPELVDKVANVLQPMANDFSKIDLVNGESLNVYVKPINVFKNKHYLSNGARKGAEIIYELKKNNVDSLKYLRLYVEADLKDQYENKFVEKVFVLNYDYQEVLKLNSESYTYYQPYLRFAQFKSLHPTANAAYEDWCSDKSFKEDSGNFCK